MFPVRAGLWEGQVEPVVRVWRCRAASPAAKPVGLGVWVSVGAGGWTEVEVLSEEKNLDTKRFKSLWLLTP